jgi:hypothetical protein
MMIDSARRAATQRMMATPHGRSVSIKNARGLKPDRA